jgi:hypothetical protein
MVVAAGIIGNIVSLLIVAVIFITLIFTKKLHFFISGLTLIALGVLPILYNAGIINIDVNAYPVLGFAAYFFVAVAAKDLFQEAYREKEKPLRMLTLVFAFGLLFFTAIPTLHKLHVIESFFDIPSLVYNVIYILSGIFLIIGIFTLIEEHRIHR